MKKEWKYLGEKPDRTPNPGVFQENPLEKIIDYQPVQQNSRFIDFLRIIGILLSIALLFYIMFLLVASVIIGADLCV